MWNKIQRIYIGENLVRPPNPYSPTSDTKFYYPFRYDQRDVTWNTSISVTWTNEEIGYKFSNTSDAKNISFNLNEDLGVRFVSYWVYCNSLPSSTYTWLVFTDYWWVNFMPVDSTSSHAQNVIYITGTASSPYNGSWYYSWKKTMTLNQWNHMAYGMASDKQYIWVMNGTVMWSWTASWTPYKNTSFPTQLLRTNWLLTVTFSDLIWESRVWTQQEIVDYYNRTKSTYWIS